MTFPLIFREVASIFWSHHLSHCQATQRPNHHRRSCCHVQFVGAPNVRTPQFASETQDPTVRNFKQSTRGQNLQMPRRSKKSTLGRIEIKKKSDRFTSGEEWDAKSIGIIVVIEESIHFVYNMQCRGREHTRHVTHDTYLQDLYARLVFCI